MPEALLLLSSANPQNDAAKTPIPVPEILEAEVFAGGVLVVVAADEASGRARVYGFTIAFSMRCGKCSPASAATTP